MLRSIRSNAAFWRSVPSAIFAKCPSEGLSLEIQVLFGRRVYEILTFAANHDVDLIILSSHKLDPENATEGWGTISFKVGVLSHCPVMLVK